MKFKPKRSRSFGILFLIIVILVLAISWFLPRIIKEELSTLDNCIVLLVNIVVASFFLWLWEGTFYTIDNKWLVATFGPFRWKVLINEINYIRLNQKVIGGMIKLTLSSDSIEIRYKKRNSIFISPDAQSDFIAELKRVNDKIEIKEK
jgi:hypothetical protein